MHQPQKSEAELAVPAPHPPGQQPIPAVSPQTAATPSAAVSTDRSAPDPSSAGTSPKASGKGWWPTKGEWAKDWPLWGALAAIVVSIVSVFCYRSNPITVLFIMVAGNSVAQMFIDFIDSDRKPRFSALARGIPIVAGAIALLTKG